ncbi:MAG: ABC transporter ATP-binding protein/permease [Anaerolineae bacterium]|jgi:ATP-binding cassette subfamily B protein|nr:ABC transporter ATP-binding protein/permease [Anaerolineae bacterium]
MDVSATPTTPHLTHLIKRSDYDLQEAVRLNRFAGLWRMITGYRAHYIWAIMSQVVAVSAKTGTMVLLSFLIDDVLSRGDVLSVVPLVALGFVGLATIEGSFTFLSGRYASQTAEGVAYRLRNYLYDHLQRQPFSYHDKQPTGDLMQRVTSDVDMIRRFLSEMGTQIGRILLLFLVNWLVILTTIHAGLGLFSAIVVPIVFALSMFFFGRVEKRFEEVQSQEAKVSTRLQENLTGVRVVKAFSRQNYEMARFDEENAKHFQKNNNLLLMHSLFWPLTDLLTGFHQAACYFFGAMLALNGDITPGQYIAFVGMVVYIIHPMRNMGRLIVQGSQALVAYDRVVDILKHNREPLGEAEAAPVETVRGAVEFKGVSFEYERGLPVLKDVNFSVKPGQVVALMGATGSGKTTVVNLLMRFYDHSAGQITLDGVDIRDYPRDFLRRSVGVVEQEPFLFSRTIRENITYGVGRKVSDEEVFAAARAAAVHHVIESFPEGYNTLVGERGVTLSGGQKQRVAIARTLLKDPRILVLDDATSSVDSETEAAIRDAVKQLLPGRTAFIIAHRVQTVMAADQILVFDDGHIVQSGTHAELVEQEDGFYRKIYDMQSRIDEEVEKELGE